MIIRQLNIINFKSIETASLSLSHKVNCFVGLNGMGKTNILDALHYLSLTKSHLGIHDNLAVRSGQDFAILEGVYQSDSQDERHLLLQISPGKRKILKRNKKEYERLSEHIGAFPLVIISPYDSLLIQGGSEERRRFIDQQLSQEDATYLSVLTQYNKALAQRNALLKAPKGATDTLLDVIDMKMGQLAEYIYRRRSQFVADFVPHFQRYYSAISGGQEVVQLCYESQLSRTDGDLYRLLVEVRERDRILGHTTRGVHRDDLQMLYQGEQMRRIGSQGQCKTYLISLKLAQYHVLSLKGERPLLLLDDIFDKLDSERVGRIVSLVGGEDFGQIFITDTNREHLDSIVHTLGKEHRVFSVQHGVVSPQHSNIV